MEPTIHARSIGNSLLIVIIAIIAVILQVLDKTFGNTFTISLGNVFPQADLVVFGLMALITIAIQFVLIKKTRESVKVERSKSRLGECSYNSDRTAVFCLWDSCHYSIRGYIHITI